MAVVVLSVAFLLWFLSPEYHLSTIRNKDFTEYRAQDWLAIVRFVVLLLVIGALVIKLTES